MIWNVSVDFELTNNIFEWKAICMEHSISNQTHIDILKEKIADLKKQIPKHSIPPTMIMALEDLEDSLAQALQAVDSEGVLHA